jgi:hypothetical protein
VFLVLGAAAAAVGPSLRAQETPARGRPCDYEVRMPAQISWVSHLHLAQNGDTVLAGQIVEDGFPTTPGAAQPARLCPDAYCISSVVMAFSPAGEARYATYVDGEHGAWVRALAPAPDGSYWVVVDGQSPQWGQARCTGYSQPVLARIRPGTAGFHDVKCIGGPDAGWMLATDLAVAPDASVWVTGQACGAMQVANAWQPVLAGYCDAFLARYVADRPEPLLATYLGGSSYEMANQVALVADGDVIVTGLTVSGDFPAVRPQPTAPPAREWEADAFVTRFDASGRWLEYSTRLGGSQMDWGQALAVDAEGNALVAGTTWSGDFPVTDDTVPQADPRGGDAFLVGLDATGALRFATLVGGSREDDAHGVATRLDGSVVLVGETMSTDLAHERPAPEPYQFRQLPFLTWLDEFAARPLWRSVLMPDLAAAAGPPGAPAASYWLHAVTFDRDHAYLALAAHRDVAGQYTVDYHLKKWHLPTRPEREPRERR